MTEPARIAIAGEDHAHRHLARHLTDAALMTRQRRGWPEVEQLHQAREWTGYQHAPDAAEEERFYRVTRLDDDMIAHFGHRLKRVPRIGGQPAGHAAWFILLFQLFAARQPPVAAIVVIDDGDGGRSSDLDARRAEAYIRETFQGPSVAFGVAEPTAEGWLLHLRGERVPASPDEAKRAFRAHRGLPVVAESAPHEDIGDALADVSLEGVTDPNLKRFIASLRDHVAPAVLR